MTRRFRDRTEAGRMLAEPLRKYAGRGDVVVLALPRGGVPVAYEVAKELGAPLRVFVVRKLGVPGHEEFAMGALASGGLLVLDETLVRRLGIGRAQLDQAIENESRELVVARLRTGTATPPWTWRGRRSSSSTTGWRRARRCERLRSPCAG